MPRMHADARGPGSLPNKRGRHKKDGPRCPGCPAGTLVSSWFVVTLTSGMGDSNEEQGRLQKPGVGPFCRHDGTIQAALGIISASRGHCLAE